MRIKFIQNTIDFLRGKKSIKKALQKYRQKTKSPHRKISKRQQMPHHSCEKNLAYTKFSWRFTAFVKSKFA